MSVDAILSVEDGQDIEAVTLLHVSRVKVRRPRTSPVVCRVC